MPVQLADLKRDRRTVTIDLPMGENDDGEMTTEPIVVTYRPSAYTANAELDFNDKLKGDWKSEMALAFVHTLVVEWDLMDGDEKYPLWPQHPDNFKPDGTIKSAKEGYDHDLPCLAALPQPFMGHVIAGIAGDMGKAAAASNAS